MAGCPFTLTITHLTSVIKCIHIGSIVVQFPTHIGMSIETCHMKRSVAIRVLSIHFCSALQQYLCHSDIPTGSCSMQWRVQLKHITQPLLASCHSDIPTGSHNVYSCESGRCRSLTFYLTYFINTSPRGHSLIT